LGEGGGGEEEVTGTAVAPGGAMQMMQAWPSSTGVVRLDTVAVVYSQWQGKKASRQLRL
jgi:hypothetical protein